MPDAHQKGGAEYTRASLEDLIEGLDADELLNDGFGAVPNTGNLE